MLTGTIMENPANFVCCGPPGSRFGSGRLYDCPVLVSQSSPQKASASSAVHRAKPGRNLVIGQIFKFFFFTDNGLSIFLHRGSGFKRCNQYQNPIINPINNPIINPIASVCRIYLFVNKLYFTSQTLLLTLATINT